MSCPVRAAATWLALSLLQVQGQAGTSPLAPPAPAPATASELERLVRQKQDILEQLVEAVEDGRATLRQRNDTLASFDLNNIKELYQNLLKNGTLRAHGNMSVGDLAVQTPANLTAARRHKELKLHLFDFVSLTSKKKKHKEKEKELNRIIMQGKIDEWLLNRELEKKKIKNYIDRVKRGKQEQCPRTGISRLKKKKKTRRNKEPERRRRKKNSKKHTGGKYYPCCRKCCKRSYMGCL